MKRNKKIVTSLSDLREDRYYRVADLKAILANLNLSSSIFTIRSYETWKCLDYKCGKRYDSKVDVCPECSGIVRAPLIKSPRTLGDGPGVGHRRYTAPELKEIIDVFKRRD